MATKGKGRKREYAFKTSTRQAPRFATAGIWTGAYGNIRIKVGADVGLIGFPNVGKSTLLSAVTSARPKIADYHLQLLYLI